MIRVITNALQVIIRLGVPRKETANWDIIAIELNEVIGSHVAKTSLAY